MKLTIFLNRAGASGWNYFTLDILNRDDREIICVGGR